MKYALPLCVALIAIACDGPTPPVPTAQLTPEEAYALPPAWAQDASWYQIFPERFRNGDPSNDPTLADVQPGSETYPLSWTVTPWGHDWYAPEPWVADYESEEFHRFAQLRRYGGDLQGVLDKLDYLDDLGINAIYFNPLNDAPSLHKYDARHYRHIDRNFGPDPRGDAELIANEDPLDPSTWVLTTADSLFLDLVDAAHARGIRVILDYSFNHTGTDFWAFNRVRAEGAKSEVADWYEVERFDDPSTPGNEFAYRGWLGIAGLPEFAEHNEVYRPERYGDAFIKPLTGDIASERLREHIFTVTRRWLDPNGDGDPSDGVDGYRLDVAAEVGMDFWRAFRREVRAVNPEAYLVGEVWYATWPDDIIDPTPYLQGDQFDAVMNYLKFRLLRGTLAKRPPLTEVSGFGESLRALERDYDPAFARAMMNVMASHDSPRLVTSVGNDNAYKYHANPRDDEDYIIHRPDADAYARAELLTVAQFTSVGAPHVFYGEELGMWGADDPENRKPMWWPDVAFEVESTHPSGKTRPVDTVGFAHQPPSSQGADRLSLYKALTRLRKIRPELRRGTMEVLESGHPDVLRYRRSYEGETCEVYLNASPGEAELPELERRAVVLSSSDEVGVLGAWGWAVVE